MREKLSLSSSPGKFGALGLSFGFFTKASIQHFPGAVIKTEQSRKCSPIFSEEGSRIEHVVTLS